MSKRVIIVSKFLSKYLRHEPEALGLTLEPGGWVAIDELLAGMPTSNSPSLVKNSTRLWPRAINSGSHSTSPGQIRPNQGHSTEVDLQLAEVCAPEQLFHGTVEKFLETILAEGLKKMDRHDVHLSNDLQTATKVGEPGQAGHPDNRIGQDVCRRLQVPASENGVWLTDHVPPRYIRQL